MVTIGYKILFTIDILHEYYSDWRSKDLLLLPSEATQKVLNDHRMIFRPTPNGGLVLVRINDKKLQVPIDDAQNFKLTFYLESTSPFFYNRTNLPFRIKKNDKLAPNKKGYYFENLDKNDFKAPNAPNDFDKELKYLSKKNTEPITSEDEILYLPKVFNVELTSAKDSFQVVLKEKNNQSPNTYKTILTLPILSDVAKKIHQINLSTKVKPGRYKLKIDNESEQDAYISDEVFHKSPFGIIEIFHGPIVQEDYRFINGSNEAIKDIKYYLWIKNREAKWRYVFISNPATSITKTSANFIVDGNIIESQNPIAIKEDYATISMNRNVPNSNPAESKSSKIPNPDGKTLKAELKDNEDKDILYVFAETYI